MNDWLKTEILDNTISNYLLFAGIGFLAFIFKKYISRVINYIIFKIFGRFFPQKYLLEFQSIVLAPMQWFIVLTTLAIALEVIKYPEAWKVEIINQPLQKILQEVMEAILLFSFVKVLLSIVDFIALVLARHAALTESKSDDQLVPFVKDALKIMVYIVFFFVLMGAVFGINVTSLLAGLGIGGLAVAFAAQESIKDLFGSVTIFLDKPFTVGDLVKVGEVEGTIETVGFRSTKIRTNDSSLVTMPNKKIMDTMIDNLTTRDHRRVRMVLGLKYETSMEQLKKIIEDIKVYLKSQPDLNAQPCIVVFDGFGESSLNILVVYFIPFTNGEEYLIRKSDLNFAIMEIVSREKASFAFPVREIKIDAAVVEGLRK